MLSGVPETTAIRCGCCSKVCVCPVKSVTVIGKLVPETLAGVAVAVPAG